MIHVPYICPVCGGRGVMPFSFYPDLSPMMTDELVEAKQAGLSSMSIPASPRR